VDVLRRRVLEDFGLIRFGDVELGEKFKSEGENGDLGVGSGDSKRFGPRI
jgi:hypothetical protein